LHESDKLIQICQRNSAKLDTVIRNQERLEAKQRRIEAMLIEQKGQISEITLRLDHDAESQPKEVRSKRKGKSKSNDAFYQVNKYIIYVFLYMLVYIHM
jgi:hypothetical protein